MRALQVICLIALFHSILSEVVNEEIDEICTINIVQELSEYEDNSRTLVEKTFFFDEDGIFQTFNITCLWNYFLDEIIDINNDYVGDDERVKVPHVKPVMGKYKLPNKPFPLMEEDRSLREPKYAKNEERTFKDLRTIYNEYVIGNSDNILDVVWRMLSYFFTHMLDDDKENSNTDENICKTTWEIDRMSPPPIEIINSLPSCPCMYSDVHNYIKIMDENNKKEYWWQKIFLNRKINFKSVSVECLKYELEHNETLISQFCCYDQNNLLITHGPKASIIYYLTRDVTKQMHRAFYTYPITECNLLRGFRSLPPNNGNKCMQNPTSTKNK